MAEYVFNVLFSHPVHSPPSKSSKAAIARALQVYQLVNTNRKKSIYIKAGGPLFGSQTRSMIGWSYGFNPIDRVVKRPKPTRDQMAWTLP